MTDRPSPMLRFAQSALRAARDVGLLAVRASLGTVMVAHGLRRWRVIGIENEIGRLTALDMPTPEWLTWGSVVFEIIGGCLLIFGLGTIAIGLLVVVQQALTIGYLKLNNGLYLSNGGWEYNLVLAALGLVVVLYGAGRLGVDHLFLQRPEDEPEPLIEARPAPGTAAKVPPSNPEPRAIVEISTICAPRPLVAASSTRSGPQVESPIAADASADTPTPPPEAAGGTRPPTQPQPEPRSTPRSRTSSRTHSKTQCKDALPSTTPVAEPVPPPATPTPNKPRSNAKSSSTKPHSKHTDNTQQTHAPDVQK